MQIVLINQYAGSPHHGMEFRPHQMARHWVLQGHDVTIIAGSFSHLRNHNPNSGRGTQEEFIDGIRYRWIPTPSYRGNGLARLRNVSAFLRGLRMERKGFLRAHPPDCVIASSTHPFDFKIARKIALDHRAPVIWEIHDLWPLSLIELHGFSPRHPMMQIIQRAENHATAHADLIVSILPNTFPHFKAMGATEERFAVIPNGVDLSGQQPSTDHINTDVEADLNALAAESDIVLGYAGSHTGSYGIEQLIEAACSEKQLRIGVVLVGDGPEKERLQRLAERLGPNRIRFIDRLPREGALAILKKCDATFLGLRKEALFRYGIGMNKIYDAMLVGNPVIGSYTAGNDPIREAGCGISVPAQDVHAIQDAIRTTHRMSREERKALGDSGMRFVAEHHDYEVLAERFLDYMHREIHR